MALSIGIHILEQLVAGNVLTPLHNAGEAPVMELNRVMFTELSTELESKIAPGNLNVSIPQGGQAKRLIGAGVFCISNAYERGLEEAYHGSQDFFPRQPGARQIPIDLGAHPRQGVAIGNHAVILGGIAHRPPVRVIPILFAPFGITSGGLEVAIGARANPHVGPGRGNG